MMRADRWVSMAVAILAGGILIQANPAWATLIVQEPVPGQKITVDTDAGQSWYWDMAGFVNMTYDQQIAAIAGLNTGSGFAGLTGWHMAFADETTGLSSHYSDASLLPAFGPTVANPSGFAMLQGRTDDVHLYGPDWHCYLEFAVGGMGVGPAADSDSRANLSAWVVTDGVPPIPVPGAALLGVLGVGITGWLRRCRTL